MIARISRFRNLKQEQRFEEGLRASFHLDAYAVSEELVQMVRSPTCSRQKNCLRQNASESIVAPEKTRQLRQTLSRRQRRRYQRPRSKTTTAESYPSWWVRLRRRPDAVGVSCKKVKAAEGPTGKPKGIVKQHSRKALKNMHQADTKGHSIESTRQNAYPSHLSDTGLTPTKPLFKQ